MQTLYETPGLTISHDAPYHCLLTTWYGPHDGEAKQAGCEIILEQIHRTGSTRLLSDSSQDLDGWHHAIRWLSTDYYPALVASGVLALAWVLPRNLKARTDVDEVLALVSHPVRTATNPIAVDTFEDIEAASYWLKHLVVEA